jgi:Transposase IS116/IS110/IS902 family
MNVLLHRAVTDITGTTGPAILDAIVAGERDPRKLAAHRDHRCKMSGAAIAAALKGDWKEDQLFTLRQSLAAWRFHHELADECLQEVDRLAAKLESRTEAVPPPPTKRGKQPDAAVRTLLFQKFGVDVTAVDGVNTHVGYTFLTEVGPDLSRFTSPENFSSWLGLCPNNKVSGNHKLSVSTRPVSSRLAAALRMAAQSLNRVESVLGDLLPTHARQTRPGRSRHGSGPPAGAHPLHHDQDPHRVRSQQTRQSGSHPPTQGARTPQAGRPPRLYAPTAPSRGCFLAAPAPKSDFGRDRKTEPTFHPNT